MNETEKIEQCSELNMSQIVTEKVRSNHVNDNLERRRDSTNPASYISMLQSWKAQQSKLSTTCNQIAKCHHQK